MKFLTILKFAGAFIKNNKAFSFFVVFFAAVAVTAIILSVKVKNLRQDLELITIKNSTLQREVILLSSDTTESRNALRECRSFIDSLRVVNKKNNPGLSSKYPSIDQIKSPH